MLRSLTRRGGFPYIQAHRYNEVLCRVISSYLGEVYYSRMVHHYQLGMSSIFGALRPRIESSSSHQDGFYLLNKISHPQHELSTSIATNK